MKAIIESSLRSLLLATATTLIVACSDRGGKAEQAAEGPALSITSALAASGTSQIDAEADAAAASQDDSYAAAIAMPATTMCTIYPEGAGNDPARTNTIQAYPDGELRFYPPPPSWGTRLTLDCTLNGSPQGQYLVDLNDSSTFIRRSKADLQPVAAAVRPVLTGDLASIPINNLLQGGYPPRPDRATAPQAYADWVQMVTRPVQRFSLLGAANLGQEGTGVYVGPGGGPTTACFPWTGMVQAAASFVNSGVGCTTNRPSAFNLSSQQYVLYQAYMVFPQPPSCYGACNTFLWAGIGGTIVNGFASSSNMIQSGFDVTATNTTSLFWQFWFPGGTSAASTSPWPSSTAYGDTIVFWGLEVASSACSAITFSANPPYACYIWEDVTQGWEAWTTLAAPPSGYWFPTSVEAVAERSGGLNNANYGVTQVLNWWAEDFTGAYHADPGQSSATDPYIYNQTNDGNGYPLSIGMWENGTFKTPVDPLELFFKSAN